MSHAKMQGQIIGRIAVAQKGSSEREKLPTYNCHRRIVTISLSPSAAAAMSRSAVWRAKANALTVR